MRAPLELENPDLPSGGMMQKNQPGCHNDFPSMSAHGENTITSIALRRHGNRKASTRMSKNEGLPKSMEPGAMTNRRIPGADPSKALRFGFDPCLKLKKIGDYVEEERQF